MNVGILSNKLDAAIEACEEVRSAAEQNLDNLVVFVGCLNLLAIVLENDANELNHCDDERTESDRAQMVSEDPFDSLADRATAGSVTGVREVPNRTGSSNDELGAANQEGVYPKATEEVIQEDVASLLIPFNFSHKLKRSGPLLRFTN